MKLDQPCTHRPTDNMVSEWLHTLRLCWYATPPNKARKFIPRNMPGFVGCVQCTTHVWYTKCAAVFGLIWTDFEGLMILALFQFVTWHMTRFCIHDRVQTVFSCLVFVRWNLKILIWKRASQFIIYLKAKYSSSVCFYIQNVLFPKSPGTLRVKTPKIWWDTAPALC